MNPKPTPSRSQVDPTAIAESSDVPRIDPSRIVHPKFRCHGVSSRIALLAREALGWHVRRTFGPVALNALGLFSMYSRAPVFAGALGCSRARRLTRARTRTLKFSATTQFPRPLPKRSGGPRSTRRNTLRSPRSAARSRASSTSIVALKHGLPFANHGSQGKSKTPTFIFGYLVRESPTKAPQFEKSLVWVGRLFRITLAQALLGSFTSPLPRPRAQTTSSRQQAAREAWQSSSPMCILYGEGGQLVLLGECCCFSLWGIQSHTCFNTGQTNGPSAACSLGVGAGVRARLPSPRLQLEVRPPSCPTNTPAPATRPALFWRCRSARRRGMRQSVGHCSAMTPRWQPS